MQTIPLENLDKKFSALIKRAIAGEKIIFSEHEKPVAKVEPILLSKKPVADARGCAKGIILFMADDFDETPEDFKDYV